MTPVARASETGRERERETLRPRRSWVWSLVQDAAALVRAANEQTSEGGNRWHSPGRFCAQSCPAAGPNDISCRELSKDDVTRRCHSWPPQEAAGRERRVGCVLLPLTAPAAAGGLGHTLRSCSGGRIFTSNRAEPCPCQATGHKGSLPPTPEIPPRTPRPSLHLSRTQSGSILNQNGQVLQI